MKRFYNNTLIGGAFSKALRVVALLCVLLGISSSAWGATYYLWYNAKSNEPNYKDGNFTMSAGATLTNNKCVWTISNLRKDNSYFYISTSSTYSESNLKSVNIQTNNPNDAVVNGTGKQEYGGKVGFYVSCKTAGSTVTITIDFSSNSQYVVSPVGGGAAACTPSATMVSATYNTTSKKVDLVANITETCSQSVSRGFEYSEDGKTWHNITTSSSSSTGQLTHSWSPISKGVTYYFRTFAGNNKSNTVSVKIPAEGSGDVNCSNIVYLDPNNIWNKDRAWFAAFFWNDAGDKWVEMKATSCGNIYYAEIPDGYVKVIFVRMDPNKSLADGWNGKWNQTLDLTLDNECYKITTINTCTDGKSCGSWGTTDCTDGCTQTDVATNVLLSREAIVNKNAKTAKLFGYLKATDCNVYTDYGFYYCMVNDGDAPCTPNTSSTKLAVDPSEALLRGTEFTATVGLKQNPSDALQDGKTYYYRAYATSDKGTILSEEIRSFATDPCIPQYGGLSDKYNGNPIVYTINADPAFVANDCKLHFNSLQAAIDHLKATNTKDNDFKYVTLSNGSYNLNQPVEMRVVYYDDTPDDNTKTYIYRGKEIGENESFVYAGDDKPANANLIQDFNKSGADAKNTLSIKAGSDKAKPWIHHIVIRNSKNILLDSLCIYSDPKDYDATKDGNQLKSDNALEIDINTTKWNMIEVQSDCNSYTRSDNDGSFTFTNMCDANIVVQNCMIGSAGFTGLHLSAYDGITFKNNEFEAIFSAQADDNVKHRNMINYGASAKFIACKNIKFIQNNFRGSHPTLMWLQECQNVLIMNNVFWYTNELDKKNGSDANADTPDNAALRLVHQFGAKGIVKNVAAYYNTFYVAETDVKDKYNFLYFSNTVNNNSSSNEKFDISTIYFKYNNCYIYDSGVPGRSNSSKTIKDNTRNATATITEPFLGKNVATDNFCPNNFWSQYDEDEGNETSAFAFGCSDNTFTNVKSQVCNGTASGPASLIVKGQAMNTGTKLTILGISSSTGIELTANELTSDRYLIGVRPNDNTWTMGAYQSKDNIPTETIYWVGLSSDWDDRNNWEYETEVDGKMVRQRVSCVNTLSEDLKVVIEEIGTVEVAGGRKWPQIPASFTENRTNSRYDEHVSAGLGTIDNPTKFASTIELEYGAGIKGVENLRETDGTLRYDRAITHFEAERNKWLLVGPVVRPFVSGNSGTTRDVISGDYFKNFEPHVYMHETTISEDKISWAKTFGDLNTTITPNTVFAMQASKDYGPYFDNAEDYLKYEGIEVDDKSPTQFTFTGRFAVEEGDHNNNGNYVYSLKNGINLLNNVYPCNLNVQELEKLGTVILYDYEKGSFESTTAKNARVLAVVRSQNGFVFTPTNSDFTLELSQDLLTEGSTRTRSGEIVMPSFSLNIDNANTTKPGASNIVISYDEFLGSDESLRNTPKVFTKNTDTPEAYIVNKDAKYSRLVSGKEKVSIPVDIRLLKPMNLTFEKVYNEGYSEVTLVDTKTMKYYNLLRRNYTTELLESGEIEGRFYLNLAISAEDNEEDSGNIGGDDLEDDNDVPTEVEETIEEADINIYAVDNSIIRVIATGTTLKAIYVNDMAGRTEEFLVDGNFAELQLPVSSGVYTVHVIGDTATKIGKVILK